MEPLAATKPGKMERIGGRSMGLRSSLADGLNLMLKSRGKVVVRQDWLYDWQLRPVERPVYNATTLPDEARRYLVPDNPRLVDLTRRYAGCSPDVTTPSVWSPEHVRPEDLAFFRGDNAYVWQVRGTNANILGYALATYYAQSIDRPGLLDRLAEDDQFGNFTFQIAGRTVSRDLLDSVIEIDFLDRSLDLLSRDGATVLDIGAGYGRLAHRLTTAAPGLKEYLCADAVPQSTFLSEFYLRHRGIADRAHVIALDEFDQTLASKSVDLAVNVHSFSECRPDAIEWWVRRLAGAGVKHLFLVPNAFEAERVLTNERQDFTPILERHGYRLVSRAPKYRDPVVQQYGIMPAAYFLFELH
jgi:hypothetical protein